MRARCRCPSSTGSGSCSRSSRSACWSRRPSPILVVGLVFVACGLSLLGLFILQPPQFLMGFAASATQKGGLLGVFLMGLTLCVTSFTCTAPFVGSLLAVGAKGGG